jgi:hypothetical protein
MGVSIQKDTVEQFKGQLSQAIGALAVAKATYSSLMLTPAAVQLPSGSGDKAYVDLCDAGQLLELAMVLGIAAVYDRAKLDASITRPTGIERPS